MRRSHAAGRRKRARRDAADGSLAASFCDAYLADDAFALAHLLGPDVRVVVDTGGADGPVFPAVPASAGIAHALTSLRRALGDPAALRLEVRPVNGRTGLVAFREGGVTAVAVLAGRPGDVHHLWVVTNPTKLGGWRLTP